MVYCGVILAPRKRLDNRGCCRGHQPEARGAALLVVGYFNTNLAAPEGREWDEGIAAAMVEEGLEETSGQFLPRKNPWLKDGVIWAMHWSGQEMCSRTDYILGTDSRLLQNVAVRYARNNTDHYLVLGCLCGAAPDADLRYLGRSTRFPIRTPATQDRVDRMFVELW